MTELENGTILPDRVLITDEEGTRSLAPSGEAGVYGAGDITVVLTPLADAAFSIILRAPTAAVRQVHLRWRTPSGSVRVLGDHWERGYGDLEWRGIVPERRLPWYFLAYDPVHDERGTGTGAHGAGVETGANAFCWWQIDGEGYSLFLDVSCGGRGVLLGDRALTAATVRYGRGGSLSAFESAQEFCRLLCPTPRLPSHPVYGGNDWYYAYGNNSDESIRRDAALIRELSPDRENAPYMVIDAGWFPNKGCNGGPYERGNDAFPDMATLAAGITTMNVRPGIWIRPLLTADAPATWQLPENHPVRKRDKGVFLDPTIPEVKELIRADIRRLRDWGYTLIKHDFTTYDLTGRWGFEMAESLTAPGWRFADPTRTTAEIIQDMYRVIREAADEAVLIGCNTVGHLGAGLFELQRTGDDTSGREWERTRKMGVNTLAFRMAQHDTFFAVDADCVGLTDQVPWALNRQWLDLLARSGTPLFVSADPKAVGPEQAAALREAFTHAARPQPVAEPEDWLNTTCPRHWRFGEEHVTYSWSEADIV